MTGFVEGAWKALILIAVGAGKGLRSEDLSYRSGSRNNGRKASGLKT